MKQYRVNSIIYPSGNSSLQGLSADIFFFGCTHNCEDCHNKELQEFIPYNRSLEEVLTAVTLATRASVVTLMGGEPLQQLEESILTLIDGIHKLNKEVSVYTGLEFNQVPKSILDNIEYIKTGHYDKNNKTPYGEFLASKNQIMSKKVNNNWEIQWVYTETSKSK